MSRALFAVLATAGTLTGCAAPGGGTTAVVDAYPSDSGMLNVRNFGAVGDGRTDDTAAILSAVAASGADLGYFAYQNQIVYFPNGTYLVSAPIVKKYASTGLWASGMVLAGQSQSNTILKLKDSAAGYQNPASLQAVVYTSSKLLDPSGPYGGGKDYPDYGEGNDAYQNCIQNLTVDVGEANPGAVGIDYLASNLGSIRNVTVRAPAGSGATGIAMTRDWIGPALLEHVTVTGFNVGIDVANTEYGVTLNHIVLNGQLTAGLRNSQNAVSTNDLEATTIGPALISTAADGLVVLAQAQLSSTSATTVQDTLGTIVFHGSRISNYQKFTGATILGNVVDGYLTGPGTWSALSSASFTPVLDPPVAVQEPSTAWVSVVKYGAQPIAWTDATGAPVGTPTDALAAFQAAAATGASTIYLPHGLYYLSNNFVVPPTLQRIVGMDSTIRVYVGAGGNLMNQAEGMFRVLSASAGAQSGLQIENLTFDNFGNGQQIALEHSAARPLVLIDDAFQDGAIMLNRTATGGSVFLDDVTAGGLNVVSGTASVNAVQLDMEYCTTCITNQGANLTILGLKTEGLVTAVVVNGGTTEVLGGLAYMVVTNTAPSTPLFSVSGGAFTASFLEEAFSSTTHYNYLLSDTENGITTLTPESIFATRDPGAYGRIVPWLQNQ